MTREGGDVSVLVPGNRNFQCSKMIPGNPTKEF